MAEWVKVEGLSYESHKLRIGRVLAVASGACPSWEPSYSIEHDTDPMAFEQESIDAAKTAAEQALREMHGALAAHFAPVLRWSRDACPTARVGNWSASTDGRVWMIWHPSVNGPVMIERGPCETIDGGKRAAEAALRSLGVVFRTEGER